MRVKIELIYNKLNAKFISLNQRKNLKMNLIFKKELNQEKVLLVLLTNVKVKLIRNNIMQLNILNNQKVISISKKFKLDNKLNK